MDDWSFRCGIVVLTISNHCVYSLGVICFRPPNRNSGFIRNCGIDILSTTLMVALCSFSQTFPKITKKASWHFRFKSTIVLEYRNILQGLSANNTVTLLGSREHFSRTSKDVAPIARKLSALPSHWRLLSF